jgi:hypothetical protein
LKKRKNQRYCRNGSVSYTGVNTVPGEHVRGVAAAAEPFAAATVHGPARSGALDGVAAGAVVVPDAYGADANDDQDDASLSPRP